MLKDPEKRTAYDRIGERWRGGAPPPDWDAGFEFGGMPPGAAHDAAPQAAFSEFFEALFGARGAWAQEPGANRPGGGEPAVGERGEDHHAKVLIALEHAFRGATETVVLQVPVRDAKGRLHWGERRLEVRIPRGVRAGQRLRLKAQGLPGDPPGDLYAQLAIALPPAHSDAARKAYQDFGAAFAEFDPRSTLDGGSR